MGRTYNGVFGICFWHSEHIWPRNVPSSVAVLIFVGGWVLVLLIYIGVMGFCFWVLRLVLLVCLASQELVLPWGDNWLAPVSCCWMLLLVLRAVGFEATTWQWVGQRLPGGAGMIMLLEQALALELQQV